MSENKNFSQEATGIPKPRSFMVDSSVLENLEVENDIRDEIKQHRVIFEFPEGVNNVDLFDRCRMLFSTEDYETCYTVVMAMLEGKPVIVKLRNYDNKTISTFTQFQVVHKDMNLSLIPELNDYPYIINWLIEFLVGLEEKKYPLPSLGELEEQKAEKK